GDVALNTVSDDTEASIVDPGQFTVAGAVVVNASDQTIIASFAGAISLRTGVSGGASALAGSYGQDEGISTTKPFVSGATITAGSLDVEADHGGLIVNVTAGGAGSSISGGTGGMAVAGSVSVNQVLPVTEAYVSGAYLGLTGDATIKAVDNSEIW